MDILLDQARKEYGVEIDQETFVVDLIATQRLRMVC
jgi:hypothetical protein